MTENRRVVRRAGRLRMPGKGNDGLFPVLVCKVARFSIDTTPNPIFLVPSN